MTHRTSPSNSWYLSLMTLKCTHNTTDGCWKLSAAAAALELKLMLWYLPSELELVSRHAIELSVIVVSREHREHQNATMTTQFLPSMKIICIWSEREEERILAVTYDDYDNTIWNWADCIFSLEWWICVIRWNFFIDLKSVHTIPQLSQRALTLRWWNMKNHLNIFIYALLLLFQFKTESSMMIQTLFRQQCIASTTTSFSVQQLETRRRGGKENVSLELIETLRCCGFLFLSAVFFSLDSIHYALSWPKAIYFPLEMKLRRERSWESRRSQKIISTSFNDEWSQFQ